MATTLKHQTIHANKVIVEDIAVLEEANETAARADERLAKASDIVKEQVEQAGGWTVLLLLLYSCVVFLFMIIFIKLT